MQRGELSLVITIDDATGVLSAPAATARVLAMSDIIVQTSIAGQMRETLPGSLRRGTPDVSFKNSALTWTLTPRDWLKLRASTPVVKLAVLAVPKPGLVGRNLQPAAPILLGFALFDARGMEAAIQPAGGVFSGRVERSLPLRGAGGGAVLRLAAEISPAAPAFVPQPVLAPAPPQEQQPPRAPTQGSVAVLSAAPAAAALAPEAPPPAPPTAQVYEDAIQIGTASPWDHYYTLGVTLSGLVLPAAAAGAPGAPEGPFWLSYKVFGVLIQTDAFPSLAPSPVTGRLFPPVRDTFTLRATPSALAAFLSATPALRVYLCRPGQALAVAELPFQPLAAALLQPAVAASAGSGLALHTPSPCGADLAGSFALTPMAVPTVAGDAAVAAAFPTFAVTGQVAAAITIVPREAAPGPAPPAPAPVPAPAPAPAPAPPAVTTQQAASGHHDAHHQPAHSNTSFGYSGGVGRVQPVVAEAPLDGTLDTSGGLDTTTSTTGFEEPTQAGLLYLSPLALTFGRASVAVPSDALSASSLAAMGLGGLEGLLPADSACSIQVAVEYKGHLDVKKVLGGGADVGAEVRDDEGGDGDEDDAPLTQTVMQVYRCGATAGLLSSHAAAAAASVIVASSATEGAAEEDVLLHVPTAFIPALEGAAPAAPRADLPSGAPPHALPLKPFGRLAVTVRVGALGLSEPLLEARGVVAAGTLVAAAASTPSAAPTLMVPLFLRPAGGRDAHGQSIGSLEVIVTKEGSGDSEAGDEEGENEEAEAQQGSQQEAQAHAAAVPAAPAPAPAPAPGPDARDELIARLAEDAARWKAVALRKEAAAEAEALEAAPAAPPAAAPAPAPPAPVQAPPAPASPAPAPQPVELPLADAPVIDTEVLTLPQGGFSLYPDATALHRWRLSVDVRAVAGLDTGMLSQMVTAAVAAVEAQAGTPGAGSILLSGEGEGKAAAAAAPAPATALISQQPRLFVRYAYSDLARAISEEAVARKVAALAASDAAVAPPVAATTLCLPQVRSTPAVPTPRAAERLLPKAFCSVSFPGSPAMLARTLEEHPLPVEVWTSDATGSGGHSKNMKIGLTGVDCAVLTPVLHVTAAAAAEAGAAPAALPGGGYIPATGPAQFRCGVTNRVFADLRSYAQHAAAVAASLVTSAGGDAAAVTRVLQADVDVRRAHRAATAASADGEDAFDALVAPAIPGLPVASPFVFPALAHVLEASAQLPPSLLAAAAGGRAAAHSEAALGAAWEALMSLPARARRSLHKLARPVVVRLLDMRVPVAPVSPAAAARALQGGGGPEEPEQAEGEEAAPAAAAAARLCSLHVLAWLEDHGPMPGDAMDKAVLPPLAAAAAATASAVAAADADASPAGAAAAARVDVFAQLGLGWLSDDAERGEEDAKLAVPAGGAGWSGSAGAASVGGGAAPAPAGASAAPRTLDAELTPAMLSSLGEAELDALISRSPALRTRLAGRLAALLTKEEGALEAWRREAEHEWADRKRAMEDSWRREAEIGLASRAAALERAWADRETERQSTLAVARESVAKVESRLRRLVAAAEAKEREAERARDEAVRSGDAKAAEMSALARRLKEDADHASSLVKQREAAAAARVSEAHEEAATMRARYTALVGELEATKLKLAAGPDAALRDALAAAAAESRALTERVAGLEKEGVELREQLGSARVQALRLAREVAKLRAEARDREAAEAERLRVAWLAREERLVLDGDRAALRDIRRQVDAVRIAVAGVETTAGEAIAKAGGAVVGGVGPDLPLPPAAAAAPAVADAPASGPTSEVARLKAERRAALATGGPGMSASHPLIQDLDRRIALAALDAK